MSIERSSRTRPVRVAAAIFIAAALIATAAGAAKVKKADWVGDYSATAMGTGHVGAAAGRASKINIEIYRWTTPEERQKILDLIATGDGKKIRAGLDDLEHIGRIRMPGEQGYELVYAWQVEEGGKKHIIAAMNRPFASLPGATSGNSVDFLVGVAMLDPAEATGVIAPAIELAIKPDGQIDITESAADPVKLTNVKSDK
jgi:hypothetical protein